MKSMKPSRIAALYFLIIGILALMCLLVPEDGIHIDLRWPTMSEMLDQQTDTTAKKQVAKTDTVAAEPEVDENAVDTVKDTRYYLTRFYQSLDSTKTKSIRIVHYGDSQLEEDRMTMILRRNMQSKYGGGGVGLLPLHQTIPTRTLNQGTYINGRRQDKKQGPKRYLVYGPKDMHRSDGLYGVMGQSALLDNSRVASSERLEVSVQTVGDSTATERYFSRIRLVADPGITMRANGQDAKNQQLITLKDSTRSARILFTGQGQVYGFSLETPTGMQVDNIPMRGCSGFVFTAMNKKQCADYFRATNTRLIIMQFGGNAIGNNSQATIKYNVETLRKQVRVMKECAPEASIVFIGPSDMLVRRKGNLQTNEGVPYMDSLLLRMAQEEKIGYWSLYEAMGGRNSMIRWQEQNLAGKDGIHFTHKGADRAGQLLADWLEEGKKMVVGH
ncbi:MAG: hypothetical protein II144_04605 [Paludibacteraceae bacterium]|nr:hypothetical protein [Paludibacteraceae bacterium]